MEGNTGPKDLSHTLGFVFARVPLHILDATSEHGEGNHPGDTACSPTSSTALHSLDHSGLIDPLLEGLSLELVPYSLLYYVVNHTLREIRDERLGPDRTGCDSGCT